MNGEHHWTPMSPSAFCRDMTVFGKKSCIVWSRHRTMAMCSAAHSDHKIKLKRSLFHAQRPFGQAQCMQCETSHTGVYQHHRIGWTLWMWIGRHATQAINETCIRRWENFWTETSCVAKDAKHILYNRIIHQLAAYNILCSHEYILSFASAASNRPFC